MKIYLATEMVPALEGLEARACCCPGAQTGDQCKGVCREDLGESFQMNLLAKIGVDTAENEPGKVCRCSGYS